jgi:PAS domain S-box-containing protein
LGQTEIPVRKNTFEQLFDRTAVASLLLKDGVFARCNDAAAKLLGYAGGVELVTMHPSNISPLTQPDGRSSAEKAEEMIALTFQKGKHNFEWIHLRKDGSTVLVEVLSMYLQIEGEDYLHVVWQDLTGRVTQSQSESMRQLIENMGDAHLVLKDGVYVECNQAAVDLLGYPDKESLLNVERDRFYPPFQPDGSDSFIKAKEGIQLAYQKGTHSVDWTYLKYDGTEINTALTMAVAVVDGEEILHIVWRDLTGQVSQFESKSLVQLIENMGDPHLIFKNGEYLECNQAAVDLLGYPDKKSLLNVGRDKFYPPLQPDGCDSFKKSGEMISLVRKNGTHSFDWTYLKYDGSEIHTAVMMTYSVVEGEEILHIVWRDLTERLAAQSDSIKELLNRLGEATLLIKDRKYVDCNQAAADLLGYPNKASLLNIHPIKISPATQPDGRDSVEKANELMKGGMSERTKYFEWTHLKFDGTPIVVEVMLTPVTINNESLIHVIWRDISEMKDAQEQVVKLAYEDDLTGLANRRTLLERLTHVLSGRC